jgi:hypothetical protein
VGGVVREGVGTNVDGADADLVALDGDQVVSQLLQKSILRESYETQRAGSTTAYRACAALPS